MKKLLRALLIAALVNTTLMAIPASAQTAGPVPPAPTHEFFVTHDLGRPLVTVHLINGVNAPGVYHVPIDTDLAQLIAYSGGALPGTDLSEVTVRRTENGRFSVANLDFEKAMKDQKDLFRLQENDVVQFGEKYSMDRTMQWVTIASAVASIVLSIYLVNSLQK